MLGLVSLLLWNLGALGSGVEGKEGEGEDLIWYGIVKWAGIGGVVRE